MADKKISELTSLTGANAADGDLVAIVDVSATETKKITRSEFFKSVPSIEGGIVFNDTGADVDFRIESDTNTHAFFLQGSDGSVGIGTSDPGNYRLNVAGSGDGRGGMFVQSFGTGSWGLEIGSHTASSESDLVFTDNATVGSQSSLSFVAETGGYWRWMTGATSHKTGNAGATEVMRITSSGDVGIGTSSPQALLDVTGATGNQLVVGTLTNAPYTEAGILFKHHTTVSNYDGGGIRSIRNSTYNDFGLAFDVGRNGVSTEAMFISAADATPGYVGIGTSSPAEKLHISGTGETMLVTPVAYAPNQDAPYLIASATNYDGTTTNWATYGLQHRLKVNSSGVPRVTIDTNNGESFAVGQQFVLCPNGVTLGTAAGTYSAANTLDDYEEGTWTPTYAGSTGAGSFTYDMQEGYYTKIGNVVTVTGRLRTDAASGATGNAYIGGLPFTPKNVTNVGSNGCGSIGQTGDFNTEYPIGVYAGDNQARLWITTQPSANSTINVMNAANGFLDAANANGLFFSCTYVTG